MEAAALLAVAGLTLLVTGWLSAAGKLRRNVFVGIRLPSTMRDDETWQRAHRAAAVPIVAGGVALEAGAVAELIARGADSIAVIALAAVTLSVAAVLVAAVQATRAVR